jgi:glutathione S-transferase
MASIKPIVLYGAAGPNPTKVRMLIEELGLPHEIKQVDFAKVKGPEFTAINPNGRMPAIYDPNTDLTLWESGAIIEYLIEKYDTKHTLSFEPNSNEAWLAKQWLYFQSMSHVVEFMTLK